MWLGQRSQSPFFFVVLLMAINVVSRITEETTNFREVDVSKFDSLIIAEIRSQSPFFLPHAGYTEVT